MTNHPDYRNSTDLRHVNEHSLTVKLEPPEFGSSYHRRSAVPGSKGVPPLLQVVTPFPDTFRL